MNDGQLRMLQRYVAGDTPRCSVKDFLAINQAAPGVFQRESRDGADLRAGYVLCALKSAAEATKAANELLAAGGGPLGSRAKPGGRPKHQRASPTQDAASAAMDVHALAVALAALDNATRKIEKWMSGEMGGLKCIGPIPEPVLIESECAELRRVKARHADALGAAAAVAAKLGAAR